MPRRSSQTPEQWALIRKEYELTDISIDALARKYGFRSPTSIRRKIADGMWERDPEAIAVHVATRTIADIPSRPTPPERRSLSPGPLLRSGAAHSRRQDAARPTADEAGADASPSEAQRVQDKADEHEITTAHGLSRRRDDVIRQQIASGDIVEQTGLQVMSAVGDYLTAEGQEEVTRRTRRLVGLNPDRGTIAGLLLAAASLVKTGVALKRQALAMDVGKPAGEGGGAQVEPVKGAGARLLSRLSPEAMLKLREVAQEAARLPPGALDPVGS